MKQDTPKPSALGDFELPTATEDRCVPMAWGTVCQKGPNVVWYGDLRVEDVKKRVKTGLFSSEDVHVCYKYHLGVQTALCQGVIDELIEIRHDGKKPGQTITTVGDDEYKISVNAPTLFGGEEQEGGVSGTINVYRGTDTQTANEYLQNVLETPLPAYLGTAYAVFRQYYFGNSNYIKPISWTYRRTPETGIPGMNPAHANISGDCNPAIILYEIITLTRNMLGLPPAQINLASFISTAATLYAEGLGMSYLLESPSAANDLVQDVLRHIDGVCYTDPQTGLITLALARDDYDPESLPVFNTANVTSCDLDRIGWADTKNVIKLKYMDRAANFTERVCQHMDLGNIQARGGEIAAESIEYKGVSNATVAARLAARAIKSLSYPLANVHLTCNRDAWALRPGSVFLFTWAPLGISNSVYRVTRINYGSLTEGAIDLDAVEDVFSVSGDAFLPPGGTTWTDPNHPPEPCPEQALFEMPYQSLGAEKRFVGVLATRSTGQEYKAELWSDPAGGTDYTLTGDLPAFAPYGYLTVAVDHITAASVPLHIRAGEDLTTLTDATDTEHQQGKNVLLIGNEFFAWKTISANGDGTYSLGTCWRGVLDTVPEAHAAGSPVLFLSAGVGTTADVEYPADCTINVKILPKTFTETLAIGDAEPVSITTDSRAWKPLPPGCIRLNGERRWEAITGDAVVTWADRNRIAQTAAQRLYTQDEPDISGGPEGNYTVETLIDGVVVHTDTGITATTHTYPAATREADSADGLAPVILQIRGAYNGRTSVANSTDPCIMNGVGMTLGVYLGGVDR